ncbi:HesA/MoeB/ThiF family protein [Actinomyces mediterranea]|uniref:HesA/MoeB/ThiF family protein n=1 Tax=Actinomyces mediterranea TaxID=1871028 RepID=UPI001F46CAFA|nr:HesA/MoeB/ThiF family protein [Actinomyces mediterranea]
MSAPATNAVTIPLARPVIPLDENDPRLERHRRSWMVDGIGPLGQARLGAARVLVVGAGGLGSPVLAYLAAAGVAVVGMCDHDRVEETNLQRQILYRSDHVGALKTDAAADSLAALSPDCELRPFGRVTAEFLDEQAGAWDVIIDCSDDYTTKYEVADWCASSGTPLVWGTAVGTRFQVSVFWSAPPSPVPPTSLRMLHAQPPPMGATPSSQTDGVLGPVAGQAGAVMATEAIKLIAGFGRPLIGSVLVVDAASQRHDILVFAPWEGQ